MSTRASWSASALLAQLPLLLALLGLLAVYPTFASAATLALGFAKGAVGLLLWAPLLGGAALLLGGSRLGVWGSRRLTLLLGLLLAGALLGLLWLYAATPPLLRLDYGLWFSLGELRAHWSYLLDGLSLAMATLVVAVSLVTQGYSYWYLASDPSLVRFQGYLQLFTAFMLQLVLADNLAVFFLGWEGVGLCSYLLIGFWSSRPEARYAALKAVTVNRLGDLALMAAVGLMASLSGSLSLGVNLLLLPSFGGFGFGGLGHLTLINGLLLVAMAAKSAQLGLHTWLADAMEGPTPVSALIHAATMVTAGIYLALRLGGLLLLTPAVGQLLALLGGYTALFGASVACLQWDLKKIIAYSTCSQLGYMLCLCGLGGYGLAFHHLVAHGFFKALLFLAAGVLIHGLGGEQDLRRCGGLLRRRPLTAAYFGVGFAALLGLPGTSGFYSKERLLEALAGASGGVASAAYLLLWLALLCTCFYSCRTLRYALLGGHHRGGRSSAPATDDAAGGELPAFVQLLLGLLVLLVLATEALYYPLTVALGSHYLAGSGVAGATAPALLLGETLASPNRWLPFGAMALGVYAFLLSEFYAEALLRWALAAPAAWPLALARFLQRGWNFDAALNRLFFGAAAPLLASSLTLEKGLLEWLGPWGVLRLCAAAGRRLDLLQLPRSGFGQLALVPLGYLLLLLWTLWLGPLLGLHPGPLVAIYDPWSQVRDYRYPDEGISGALFYAYRMMDYPIIFLWGFLLGGGYGAYYFIVYDSHPPDEHWWEIKRSFWLSLGGEDIGEEPFRPPPSRELRFPGPKARPRKYTRAPLPPGFAGPQAEEWSPEELAQLVELAEGTPPMAVPPPPSSAEKPRRRFNAFRCWPFYPNPSTLHSFTLPTNPTTMLRNFALAQPTLSSLLLPRLPGTFSAGGSSEQLSAAATTGSGAAGLLPTPLEQFELLATLLSGSAALLPSQGYALLPLLLTLLLTAALVFGRPRLLGGAPQQLGVELLVRSLGSFLEANATRAQLPHLPLFLLLVLSLGLYNLSGLLPYGFTFSAHLVVTLFYSLSIFFGLNYVALLRHRLRYFNLFLPGGTPLGLQPLMVLLELVSYLSRPLSLAIRLFANMMAGHALLKILLSFAQKGLEGPALPKLLSLLALVAIGAILLLELMVALLQVFVFATLCSLYLVDAHNPNH